MGEALTEVRIALQRVKESLNRQWRGLGCVLELEKAEQALEKAEEALVQEIEG